MSIDSLVFENYLPPPDLVKIDVEGFELEVLKGMKRSLENYVSILFVAIDEENKRTAILDMLANLCYSIKEIFKNEILGVKDDKS